MRFVLSRWSKVAISVRIACLFCLTFSVSLILAFAISYFQMSYALDKSDQEVLSSKLQEISAILNSGDVHGLKDFLADEKNRILNAPYMVRILNKDGETVYLKPSVQEKEFDFDAAFKKTENPEKLIGWTSLAAIHDEDMFDILTRKVGDRFYLQIGKSNEDNEEVLGSLLSVFLGTGTVFIALSAGLGFWYARKSLAPLRGLLGTIKKIENGNLSERVEVSRSRDELYDIGETFNRMISRIEKLIVVMKESLDNVAHDIRTPLTKIIATAEDALTSNNPTPLKEALQDCAENANEVSELVDQLLSISEAEAGTLALRCSPCKIKSLLEEVADIYDFVAQEKSIRLSVECDPNLIWPVDAKRIKQAIGNLVDNAIKFSPEGKSVDISAFISAGQLSMVVQDQGIGIPEPERGRIWDRLYRGDKSRATQGLGLGLSIVRSIAMAHNGRAEVIANREQGMAFTIVIPQSTPS